VARFPFVNCNMKAGERPSAYLHILGQTTVTRIPFNCLLGAMERLHWASVSTLVYSMPSFVCMYVHWTMHHSQYSQLSRSLVLCTVIAYCPAPFYVLKYMSNSETTLERHWQMDGRWRGKRRLKETWDERAAALCTLCVVTLLTLTQQCSTFT